MRDLGLGNAVPIVATSPTGAAPAYACVRMRLAAGDVVAYRFPGRWMDDDALAALRNDLEGIAGERLGTLPPYGVFLPGRAPYCNRIVTVLRPSGGGRALGFAAMVDCPVVIHGQRVDVLNLGLMIARSPGPRGTHAALYALPLMTHYLARVLRPYWVATFTALPRSIAAVASSFGRVRPDLRAGAPPDDLHRAVARAFFASWRHESGVGPAATFDDRTFVVRASDSGPSAVFAGTRHGLDDDTIEASYVRATLDLARGDDLLVLGRVDALSVLRQLWRSMQPRA